ncbi:MAG: coproporphyrinogen dehydrogenase HemZ, partial [Clostridia bacterium]|nr:coproporphyrinogen dehydrogenase HemZ [Clostridia bacterium]
GILTGVRPGKLAHKLVDGGPSFALLPNYLQEKYLLPAEQAQMLTNASPSAKMNAPFCVNGWWP